MFEVLVDDFDFNSKYSNDYYYVKINKIKEEELEEAKEFLKIYFSDNYDLILENHNIETKIVDNLYYLQAEIGAYYIEEDLEEDF